VRWSEVTLYVFCGRHLLAAKLRPANIDAAAGSVEEVERIVQQLRARWPRVRIVLRADSGFAREALMAWCEQNKVDYLFGLARNVRLAAKIETELADIWFSAGLGAMPRGDARRRRVSGRRPPHQIRHGFGLPSRGSVGACRKTVVVRRNGARADRRPRARFAQHSYRPSLRPVKIVQQCKKCRLSGAALRRGWPNGARDLRREPLEP
jgi:hypothetical protein